MPEPAARAASLRVPTATAVPTVTATTLPVVGSTERFPVRRVYCVGRNYRDHAVEMGGNPDREPPFFFSKPSDAIFAVAERSLVVPYPARTDNLSHEVELVVAIGATAASVSSEDALKAVWGYTVGIDLTRRDLQDDAKATRRPWDMSKGFDSSGPCAAILPVDASGHPSGGRIWLDVNGTPRQSGDLAEQIWSVPEIVAELSTLVSLEPGDLIFTGTPAGVGRLQRGDVVTAGIEGAGELEFTVA